MGAGRVEDTYNLVGHALKKIMRVVADQQERELTDVASEAGAELVCGSSLKTVLDRDWDRQQEKDEALVLRVLHTVEAWVQQLADQEDKAAADPILAIAKQVEMQDVQISEEGKVSLIKRVAKDRRISVEDSEMRHGRKRKRRKIQDNPSLFVVSLTIGVHKRCPTITVPRVHRCRCPTTGSMRVHHSDALQQ